LKRGEYSYFGEQEVTIFLDVNIEE
jgi:hypothetical protein